MTDDKTIKSEIMELSFALSNKWHCTFVIKVYAHSIYICLIESLNPGLGNGTNLLREFISVVDDNYPQRITLDYDSDRKWLIEYYERLGFVLCNVKSTVMIRNMGQSQSGETIPGKSPMVRVKSNLDPLFPVLL